MNAVDFPIPAAAAARRLTSFCLLAISALLLQLVLRFNLEAQALPASAGGNLAHLKTHGFAVLLGVMAMLNIAWFRALIRVQAAESRLKARSVAARQDRVTETR